MKQTILLILLLLSPFALYAQVELHPIYTSPHMGAGAKFSEDGSKIVTWGGYGFSVWETKSGKVLYTVTGHDGYVNYAEFNHKGTAIVTASDDNTAKVWSAQTGGLIYVLKGHKDWVCYAKFNATDDRILTRGEDGNALLWESNNGILVANLSYTNSETRTIAIFNNAGDRIGLLKGEKTIEVYESLSGRLLFEKKYIKDECSGFMFSDDDKEIVANSGKAILHFTIANEKPHTESDIEPNKEILGEKRVYHSCIGLSHTCRTNTIAFNTNSKAMAHITGENEICVVDYRNKKQKLCIKDTKKEYNKLTFNNDGSLLLISNGYGAFTIWSMDSYKCLYSYDEQLYRIKNAEFDPSGKMLLITHEYGLSKILDAYTGKIVKELIDTSHITEQNVLKKNKRCSVDRMENNTVAIRDECTNKVLCTFYSVSMPVFALYFHNSSRFIIQYDSMIEIRNPSDGALIRTFAEKGASLFLYELRSDPNKFKTNENNVTEFWDTHSCRKTDYVFPDEGTVIIDALFHGSSAVAFAVNRIEECFLLDITNGREILRLGKRRFPVSLMAVGDTQLYAIFADTMGTVTVYDINKGKESIVLRGHKGHVFDAVINTKGSRIVTSSDDGTAKVWNMFTGELIGTLYGSRGYLYGVCFSDDEQRIITKSSDWVIRIYDANQLPYSFTDIPEEEKQTEITLSPNPVQNELHITFSEPIKERGEYVVLSPRGEQIAKGIIEANSMGMVYRIDNSLCNGSYVCVIRTDEKKHEEKFVVMR